MSNLVYPTSIHIPLDSQHEDSFSSELQQSPLLPAFQELLRKIFMQIDLQNSGSIDFKGLAALVTASNVKLRDKKAYQEFFNYLRTHDQELAFPQFVNLVEKLDLSERDLVRMITHTTIDPGLNKFVKEKPKDIRIQLPNEKYAKLKEGFERLCRLNEGKLQTEDLMNVTSSIDDPKSQEIVAQMFEELDLEEKGQITFDDLLLSLNTKKGVLSTHNLMALSQRSKENAPRLVYVEDYLKPEQMSEDVVLDLMVAFDMFDVQGTLAFERELLKEHEEKIKSHLSYNEKKILESLNSLSNSNLSFDEFASQFVRGISDLENLTNLASKFSQYWNLKEYKDNKESRVSTFIFDEEKSPLQSTLPSLQSLTGLVNTKSFSEEPISTFPFLKHSSTLSSTDLEHNPSKHQSGTHSQSKIDTTFDEKSSHVVNKVPEGLFAKKSSTFPCTLASLVEDELERNDGSRKLDDNEMLKHENATLRHSLIEKEKELEKLRENLLMTQIQLDEEVASKSTIINRAQKEQEAFKAHLEVAQEEIAQMKCRMNDSAIKLKKANDETLSMKKRLAEKVKEVLIQKEKIDAVEKKYSDKNRDIEALLKRKAADEKAYEENITSMKGKLNFLTQKFTEYLTQNTSLQSELQEKNNIVRKMDIAFKDHVKKADDQKQKLDFRILELEEKLKLSSETSEKVEKLTGPDVPFSPDLSRREMEKQLRDVVKANEDLKDMCQQYEDEKGKLKQKLIEKNQYMKEHTKASENVNGKMDNMHTELPSQTSDHAKALIESLRVQLEDMRKEKESLEEKLEINNVELEKSRAENLDLTKNMNEYKLEFNYLNECLNESLWRNGGSNDSFIFLPNERVEDHGEKRNQIDGEMNIDGSDQKMFKDPRESLSVVHTYVQKLETLDQKTKGLDEEIQTMNEKIEVLRQKNSEKEDEEEKKGILDVYKKMIESKQLEVEALKKRVKGKTGLVSANMRLLSKLEALLTQKLDELNDVSGEKDKLAVENNKLNLVVREQLTEIERLKSALNKRNTQNKN